MMMPMMIMTMIMLIITILLMTLIMMLMMRIIESDLPQQVCVISMRSHRSAAFVEGMIWASASISQLQRSAGSAGRSQCLDSEWLILTRACRPAKLYENLT